MILENRIRGKCKCRIIKCKTHLNQEWSRRSKIWCEKGHARLSIYKSCASNRFGIRSDQCHHKCAAENNTFFFFSCFVSSNNAPNPVFSIRAIYHPPKIHMSYYSYIYIYTCYWLILPCRAWNWTLQTHTAIIASSRHPIASAETLNWSKQNRNSIYTNCLLVKYKSPFPQVRIAYIGIAYSHIYTIYIYVYIESRARYIYIDGDRWI